MKTLQTQINEILELNGLEYYKDSGEYWLITELKPGQYFFDKFRYCTNARTKRDLLNFLNCEDLEIAISMMTR